MIIIISYENTIVIMNLKYRLSNLKSLKRLTEDITTVIIDNNQKILVVPALIKFILNNKSQIDIDDNEMIRKITAFLCIGYFFLI